MMFANATGVTITTMLKAEALADVLSEEKSFATNELIGP